MTDGMRRIMDVLLRMTVVAATIALALLSLTGCDDVSIVTDQTTGQFSAAEYARDAAQGPIPVTVIGSALGARDERLARAVLEHVQGADWAPHARLVLASTPDSATGGTMSEQEAAAARMDGGRRTYSYVLMFNGPNVTAAALCARRPLPPMTSAPGDNTSVRLVAGLCRNDAIATAVTGRVYRVTGLDDDRFHRLIVGVMQTLTRPNQPQINR
jgi:hypothetical protein